MRIANGYSEMAIGKLNMVMPSTANPACICIRNSSSESSMRNWSMRSRNSLLRQRYFSFSRMANGLLRKSMTSQRSSSGNTLPQSVRKLKRNFSTRPGLQKYTHGMVYNFSCDQALPEFGIEIDRRLRKYRACSGKVHLIEKIRSRAEELRGHWVYWS